MIIVIKPNADLIHTELKKTIWIISSNLHIVLAYRVWFFFSPWIYTSALDWFKVNIKLESKKKKKTGKEWE